MLSLPALLSLLVGFLSLSEEILWVRTAGFVYHTQPPAFSFVLVFYLIGIALGAGLGKRLCDRTRHLYAMAAVVLSVAAVVDVSMPALIGGLMTANDDRLGIPAVLIAVTAAAKSALFPIAHDLGSVAEGPRIGRSVSRIYFANIVGSTLGPLLTGFVALDRLSIDECFAVSSALCLGGSALCLRHVNSRRFTVVPLVAIVVSCLAAGMTIRSGPGVLVKFADRGDGLPVSRFIANRHGVVHTVRAPAGDVVFGGNVYDGLAEVDVERNKNRLDRVYLAGLLHPDPRRILFVGMATGAWVRCFEGFSGVERIDVVEINPAYLDLIREYPKLATLLDDARVHVHVDDGRRWLRRHPDERFDVIIQNTTYYWRSNADNLLSRDYFAEVAHHLESGGLVAINSTSSSDVLATAQAVFGHAYRYANFVYAADHPLTLNLGQLVGVRKPDGSLFDATTRTPGSAVAQLANAQLDPVPEFFTRRKIEAEVITDDNLVTEYRNGHRFGPVILQLPLPVPTPPFLDAW